MGWAAAGSTALQRWSRDGTAERQAPPSETRYGQIAVAASRAVCWIVGRLTGRVRSDSGPEAGGGASVPTGTLIPGSLAGAADTLRLRPRPNPCGGAWRHRGVACPGNAKILATTYFPERLPSQYLRRWRA